MNKKMIVKITCIAFMVVVVSGQSSDEFASTGIRTALRIYDECNKADGGFTPCLKKKAITFMDRAARLDKIVLGEGMFVVKASNVEIKSVSENDLENSLPKSLDMQDETLNNMLMERIVAFFNSRTLQVNLPKLDSQELGRSIEEGRGKMKKMMGTMMMGVMMKMAAMVPIAIAGLFLLAGKALIISKIALLLSGIIALKKLLSQKNGGGGGHESHGWSGGSGGSGGWDRRSISAQAQAEAQRLAYSSYHP